MYNSKPGRKNSRAARRTARRSSVNYWTARSIAADILNRDPAPTPDGTPPALAMFDPKPRLLTRDDLPRTSPPAPTAPALHPIRLGSLRLLALCVIEQLAERDAALSEDTLKVISQVARFASGLDTNTTTAARFEAYVNSLTETHGVRT